MPFCASTPRIVVRDLLRTVRVSFLSSPFAFLMIHHTRAFRTESFCDHRHSSRFLVRLGLSHSSGKHADNGNNLVAKGIFRNAATRLLASERPLWQSTERFPASSENLGRAISSLFESGAFSSREITVFTISNCSE